MQPMPVSFEMASKAAANSFNFSLSLQSHAERAFSFELLVDARSVDYVTGIISAAVILVFLNILIATEVILNF